MNSFSIVEFTLLDWLVLAIITYSVVSSAMRGFVREVLGLATVVTALFLAAWFYDDLSLVFGGLFATEEIALFLAFALLFTLTLVAGFTTIWLAYRAMKVVRVEWFDRVLGGAFGFVRGWLIGVAIFISLTAFEIQASAVRNSELGPYVLAGSRAVASVTPFDLRARFIIGYERIQDWWMDNLDGESPPDANVDFENDSPESDSLQNGDP